MRFARDKKNIIKHLSKLYNVKYRLKNLKDTGGLANLELEIIEVNKEFGMPSKKREMDVFISTIFHEVCHIIATRNRKYAMYHNSDLDSQKDIDLFRRYALRAELYVDKMAQKMCKKLFPKVRYNKTYRSKREREYLKKWLDRYPKKYYKEVPITFNMGEQ